MRAQYSVIIAMVLLTILIVSSMYYIKASSTIRNIPQRYPGTAAPIDTWGTFRNTVWAAAAQASATGDPAEGYAVLDNWAGVLRSLGYQVIFLHRVVDIYTGTGYGYVLVNVTVSIMDPMGAAENLSYYVYYSLTYIAVRYGFWPFWYYVTYIHLSIETPGHRTMIPVTPENSNIRAARVDTLEYDNGWTIIRFVTWRRPPNPLRVTVYNVTVSAYRS